MQTSPHSRFTHSSSTTSPKQRRQLGTLVIMAGIILILLWILLAPIMYRKNDNTSDGFIIFQRVGHMMGKTFSTVIQKKSPEMERRNP